MQFQQTLPTHGDELERCIGTGVGKRINYEKICRNYAGKDVRLKDCSVKSPIYCLIKLPLTVHATNNGGENYPELPATLATVPSNSYLQTLTITLEGVILTTS